MTFRVSLFLHSAFFVLVSDFWHCPESRQCVHQSFRCDGETHCADLTDETNCTGESRWSVGNKTNLGVFRGKRLTGRNWNLNEWPMHRNSVKKKIT